MARSMENFTFTFTFTFTLHENQIEFYPFSKKKSHCAEKLFVTWKIELIKSTTFIWNIFNMFDGYLEKYCEIVVYPSAVYGGQW
jgi:hypothetical protein